MSLLGWALIQADWCPYKKRRLGHTERHQGCARTAKRPCEDPEGRWPSASQRREASEETEPADTLILDF